MTAGDRFRRAVGPVLAALDRADVPWCLTGSTASVHYGVPRATMDVDVVVDFSAARVKPFCRALGDAYYVSEEAAVEATRRKTSFNVVHVETAVKVDLFVLRNAPYDRESFLRRRREEVFPFGACFVPSPEDVVLRKLLWYESGGRSSDRQWSDVLGVLKVQGPGLDRAYLGRWAAELGVGALLADAESSAGDAG